MNKIAVLGFCPFIIFTGLLACPAEPVSAQADNADEVVAYPASFFQRYQPNTALDMVRQLPGFQLDDGDNVRGFGSAASNILINDRRPSAKQDAVSAILARIPATSVERIDLLRGQVQGIDLRRHSVVANIHLNEDSPAAIRWEAGMRKHSHVKTLREDISISMADNWSAIDYNIGIAGFRSGFGDIATSNISDGSDILTEVRTEKSKVMNHTGNGFLNVSTWLGGTLLQLNSNIRYSDREELTTSHRVPQAAGSIPRAELFGDYDVTTDFEIGFDAERNLFPALLGKLILLFYNRDQDRRDDQRITEATGNQTLFRVEEADRDTMEAIARIEFDWLGWSGHSVQVNIEGVYNLLDNSLVQIRDTGFGPVPVDIPIANSRVEEERYNGLIKDTWSRGNWNIDYGLGAETSTISQSGDAEQKRDFFFIKLQGLLTYSHDGNTQTRMRLAREVAQLDFNDFVSASVFQDNDVVLGNPDLSPESTWVGELSHERRFGELGVVTLTLFHHWISDVLDLLPITSDLEVPGNIGNGRRWGVEVESTLPLDWTGLIDARLDILARWQDSSVTDPVTGDDRVLTASGGFLGVPTGMSLRDGNDYAYSAAFRQDFRDARVAWGWNIAERGERPRFKVNELDAYNEGVVFNAFVETTRWLGIKVRFEAENILDLTANRSRTIYTGERSLSLVSRREIRNHSVGRRFAVVMSGSF